MISKENPWFDVVVFVFLSFFSSSVVFVTFPQAGFGIVIQTISVSTSCFKPVGFFLFSFRCFISSSPSTFPLYPTLTSL